MTGELVMELESELALVTSAASGIGAAATRLFVQRRARVFAADMNGAKLKELADELGQGIVPHQVDISQHAQVEEMVSKSVDSLHDLNVLIDNAGIGSVGRAADLDPDE